MIVFTVDLQCFYVFLDEEQAMLQPLEIICIHK